MDLLDMSNHSMLHLQHKSAQITLIPFIRVNTSDMLTQRLLAPAQHWTLVTFLWISHGCKLFTKFLMDFLVSGKAGLEVRGIAAQVAL